MAHIGKGETISARVMLYELTFDLAQSHTRPEVPKMKFYRTAPNRALVSVTVITAVALSLSILATPALARKDSRRRATPDATPSTPSAEDEPNDELALAASSSAPSSGQDAADSACAAAYRSAQQQEESNHLIEAKELWVECAKATCPTSLQRACMAKQAQMDFDIPSVVPLATDASGAPRTDVQVKMDGEVFARSIDGRALRVNPGMHEFVFSADGVVLSTQKLLIAQGQRNRVIAPPGTRLGVAFQLGGVAPGADLSAAAGLPTQDTGPKRHIPALSLALGGAGLAGIGGFALLTNWGRKDNTSLSQCAPACPQATVDHIHRLYLEADVSLGVGLVALGAAYWAYAVANSGNEETETKENTRPDTKAEPKDDERKEEAQGATKRHKPTRHAVMFGVQPTPSGAFGAVSGAF